MSAQTAGTQAAPGAGQEDTPQQTLIKDNVSNDELAVKATEGNGFQQAIAAWRSMFVRLYQTRDILILVRPRFDTPCFES